MSTQPVTYPPAEWRVRTDAALNWVRRSIAATGNRGSSHSYSPFWGWAKAYPETTGYIIETLLNYALLNRDATLRALACDCGDWLCSIQLPDGAFTGRLIGYMKPSVFNTAQILSGLVKLDKEILAEEKIIFIKKQNYRLALERAAAWLNSIHEPDGAWRQGAYRPGFNPSYNTRAVWVTLLAARYLQREDWVANMRRALHYYAGRFEPDGTVRDWGLDRGDMAFTHTVAYTLEGFLECGLLLGEGQILERTIASAEALLAARGRAGRTAGRYRAGWAGDYSFSCPVGTAQLSIFFNRLWQHTKAEKYRRASSDLLAESVHYQNLGEKGNTHGALPGSAPFWGPYLRFRYPNWGVKFLLDALANWAPGTI